MPLVGGADLNGTASGDPTESRVAYTVTLIDKCMWRQQVAQSCTVSRLWHTCRAFAGSGKCWFSLCMQWPMLALRVHTGHRR
eukprot:1252380-Pleurochrysis_carterae.AAC.2